jgi:ribosomal protein L34
MLAPRPGKPVRDVTKRGRLVLASRPRAKQRTATVSRQTA